MRVVGGEWRGRRLQAPAGRVTRPTGDKVREAVFDVLQALVEPVSAAQCRGRARLRGDRRPLASPGRPLDGHAALDLFAGMGGLGIEALSRGAASCTFVENDGRRRARVARQSCTPWAWARRAAACARPTTAAPCG